MTVRRGLIAHEDLEFGSSTFSRMSRTGFPITVNQVSDLIDGLAGPIIDARRFSLFTDAVTAAIGKTLLIAGSISLPAGAITIPATVLGVVPIAPGVINKGSATSLTINAPVVGNPMHQWLSGFGTNNLYFGSGAINAFYVEWLGAISGSSANQATNGIALQNCLNIFVSNIMEAGTKAIPKIKLTGQYYYSGSGLTIATGAGEDIEMFVLEGEVGGIWSANTDPNLSFSRLHYTGTGYALTVGSYGICFARGCSFKNFALTGTSSALGGFNGDELHSSVLKDILITGFTATNAHGLKIKGIGNVSYSSSFYGNYNGALVERNYNTFYNCTFTNNDNYGFTDIDSRRTTLYNCQVQGNNAGGVYINNTTSGGYFAMIGGWVEANGGYQIYIEGASGSSRHTYPTIDGVVINAVGAGNSGIYLKWADDAYINPTWASVFSGGGYAIVNGGGNNNCYSNYTSSISGAAGAPGFISRDSTEGGLRAFFRTQDADLALDAGNRLTLSNSDADPDLINRDANEVQLTSVDISAGNTTLNIKSEGTEIALTGQADIASTKRVKISINGAIYTLLAE